jgi:hypothetical protein
MQQQLTVAPDKNALSAQGGKTSERPWAQNPSVRVFCILLHVFVVVKLGFCGI